VFFKVTGLASKIADVKQAARKCSDGCANQHTPGHSGGEGRDVSGMVIRNRQPHHQAQQRSNTCPCHPRYVAKLSGAIVLMQSVNKRRTQKVQSNTNRNHVLGRAILGVYESYGYEAGRGCVEQQVLVPVPPPALAPSWGTSGAEPSGSAGSFSAAGSRLALLSAVLVDPTTTKDEFFSCLLSVARSSLGNPSNFQPATFVQTRVPRALLLWVTSDAGAHARGTKGPRIRGRRLLRTRITLAIPGALRRRLRDTPLQLADSEYR
jgi:hypothetical protein